MSAFITSAVIVAAAAGVSAYTQNKAAKEQRKQNERMQKEAEAARVSNQIDKQNRKQNKPAEVNSGYSSGLRSSHSTGLRRASAPSGISSSLGV